MLKFWQYLRGKRTSTPRDPFDLDATLFRWDQFASCTVGQATENILVMGGTGSGKTSGSGRTIALSMLHAGFGGLVLTAKPDERRAWEHYCRDTGRSKDLLVIEPEGELRYNVLDCELEGTPTGGLTHNMVSLLTTVMERTQSGGEGGKGDDRFWADASRQMLTNAVELLLLAKGRITAWDLYRLITSAPNSLEQLRSEEWKKTSACFRWLTEAAERPKSPPQEKDFDLVTEYWLTEFPGLNPRTRSVIVSMVSSMLDKLNRGIARNLFSSDTTIFPAQAAMAGKIVLVDLPVLQYRETGVLCQVLVKTAFQRAIQRRDVVANQRPVFLWSDEFQQICTSLDAEFLATCRSARVACVFLTQNLGNVYASFGSGDAGRSRADALFGNMNTKILHANGCPVTNQWASSIIGRERQLMGNGNMSGPTDWAGTMMGFTDKSNHSAGFSETYEFEVQPSVFATLCTGGRTNGWMVDAIVVQSGRVFNDTGAIWRPVRFLQKP